MNSNIKEYVIIILKVKHYKYAKVIHMNSKQKTNILL